MVNAQLANIGSGNLITVQGAQYTHQAKAISIYTRSHKNCERVDRRFGGSQFDSNASDQTPQHNDTQESSNQYANLSTQHTGACSAVALSSGLRARYGFQLHPVNHSNEHVT